ncbi:MULTISPECIES: DUF4825 domain-containing protein [unclassified Sutcliffiella]|uniref:DUF4825 domain-containing protein n=1 Tax=unclassified Sutcliffiella TaxID=2837532 RepID=UPI0030D48AB4
MSKQLDQKLQSLPKPKIKENRKDSMHQAIMEQKEKERDGWMTNLKAAALITASAIAVALFSFILFTGSEGEAPRSSVPEEKDYENYVSYLRDIEVHDQVDEDRAFIGNNGALGKYHGQVLPGKYYANGMELQTSEDPMGINMHYKVTDQTSATDFEKDAFHVSNLPLTLTFNATTYFAFFINGEYVTFHIDYLGEKQTYTITRQQIDDLYGRDVQEFQPDKELWEEEVINGTLTDERKVEDFMKSIRD